MNQAKLAEARRLYHHVCNGGTLTPEDVSFMVVALEEAYERREEHMSYLREAAEMALEALEWISRVNAMDYEYQRKAQKPTQALRQALAQAEVDRLRAKKKAIHEDLFKDICKAIDELEEAEIKQRNKRKYKW